jgi:hypothetical protein
VDHAVLTGHQLYEGAEVRGPDDLARVDLTDLYLLGQVADHLFGALRCVSVAGTDDYGAVVLDVDGRACLFHDAADRLAAGTDHRADLVDRYLHRFHPWRVLAHLAAISGDGAFDVVENVLPGVAGLVKGVVDHVVANALDLHVQLNGRNPIGCSGDLEVHVAHVVFLALDVGEGDVLSSLSSYQTNGDSSNGSLYGNASVHESQRARTDCCHGSRAVGAKALANQSDGVREVFL